MALLLLTRSHNLKILRNVILRGEGRCAGLLSQMIRHKHGSRRGVRRGQIINRVSASKNLLKNPVTASVLPDHVSKCIHNNEFDSQYFQELLDHGEQEVKQIAPAQPGRTLNHYMFNDIDLDHFEDIHSSFVYEGQQHNGCNVSKEDDMHFIDKQYFGKENLESEPTTAHFMDSSLSEEQMYKQFLSDRKQRQRQTSQQNKKGVNDVVSNSSDYNKAVKETLFTNLSGDEIEHSEVHHITSPNVDKSLMDSLPPDLRGKLIAEREWQEKDEDLRVGQHNISDLEDSVVSALHAIKKKRHKTTKVRRSKEQVVVGSEARDVPVSSVACSGCGAYLHCQDRTKPGFIPSEKFHEVDPANPVNTSVCQRCWYLIYKHTALNVAIPDDHYSDIIKTVRKNRRALVILMVDLLDFPHSIIKNLKELVGQERPLVIVGNKLDLLPKDEPRHEHRIRRHLMTACIEAGVCTEDKIKYLGLISAKTGYKIEELINKVHSLTPPGADVYLLGTANVGKSTLFNRLLESDLCKSKASELLGRATISRWPGTTLNLLRFPLLRPTKQRLAQRAQRLKEEAADEKARQQEQMTVRKMDKMMGDEDPYIDSYIEGNVGRTFKLQGSESSLPDENDPFSLSLASHEKKAPNRKVDVSAVTFNPRVLEEGPWFYDTPGVLHKDQVLSLLTDKELKLIVPNKGILPRSLILKPRHTLFLGGLGRLDYHEGVSAIFLTVFSSNALPIRVVATSEAEDFYREKFGTKHFVVPQGEETRLQSFPELIPSDMTLQGEGKHKSVADVLFSSIGWVAVTANQGMDVHLRAFTPGGLGCTLRRPALIPYGFRLRGKRRSPSSPYYNVDKNKLLMFSS